MKWLWLLRGFFVAFIAFVISATMFYWVGILTERGAAYLAAGTLLGSYLAEFFWKMMEQYSDNTAGRKS